MCGAGFSSSSRAVEVASGTQDLSAKAVRNRVRYLARQVVPDGAPVILAQSGILLRSFAATSSQLSWQALVGGLLTAEAGCCERQPCDTAGQPEVSLPFVLTAETNCLWPTAARRATMPP